MFYTRNSLKQQNSYETTLNIQSELALYFTISRSESIFLIYSNKNCFKALFIERFPKYVFHNNWILFIPLQWVQSLNIVIIIIIIIIISFPEYACSRVM
jgi:hypothetical protein